MQEDEFQEFLKERYDLSIARIHEIGGEETVQAPFSDYFRRTAEFLLMMEELKARVDAGRTSMVSGCDTNRDRIPADCADGGRKNAPQMDTLQQCEEWNERLYQDILPGNYESSYANPEYAEKMLGEGYGKLLSFLYTELRGMIVYVYEQRFEEQVILLELFIEIYNCFENAEPADHSENTSYGSDAELPSYRELQQILYWFVSDYSELFVTHRVQEAVDPSLDFATRIVMDSNLEDPRYLYQYGEYVTENERKMAAFLNALPEEEIAAMADTFTEGYRIGFLAGGKDLSRKKTVNIRYQLGFERMIRRAIQSFEKMGLRPVIYRAAVSTLNKKQHQRIGYTGAVPNPQYDYDHRADSAVYLDNKFVERRLGVMRTAYEEYRQEAREHGGPAVVEVFGETPFTPAAKPAAYQLSERQQKLSNRMDNEASQITNQYIIGKERSFTIIAFPVPQIGPRFPEIFRETIKVNTLDYSLYQRIQQVLIDALDEGVAVHIQGQNGNRTDLTVALTALTDPDRQTIFENCVADVNIPVGEVFTSPKLGGTNGLLHVKQVYLGALNYIDLSVRFTDGMVTDYDCGNFASEEENRKYFFENVMYSHETLPLGEFAIGTNTTAYVMARRFDIAGLLPILIAEKTGPHFAIGDTCYSWQEDTPVYNPDGKEIIARDNEVTLKRKEDPSKAYFGCHTDITIPYEEIGHIQVIRADGSRISLLENGRFVLPGTEELNAPLDEATVE
ncbi:MAG: aminopeptidase [Clostridiales bacterium]|nr:aminopeptidase [Clostridiales bacterium]